MTTQIDDSKVFDPVFAKYGQKVYSAEYIQQLREENLQNKRDGKRIYNLIPQEGFQENVMLQDADIQIIGGKRGGGKVLSNDSDIITPFGIKKNGDLKVGDILTDPCTGGMERVIAIYEHPNHDFYELMFDDGSSVECGLEHLWKVRQTGYIHKDRHLNGGGIEKDYRIWTFGMIKEWLDKQESGMYTEKKKGATCKKHLVIPLTEPVKFTKSGNSMRKNDIDPYLIGAILGDGSVTEGVHDIYTAILTASADDLDVVKQFEASGIDMSKKSVDNRTSGVTYHIRDAKLEEALTLCKLYGHTAIDKFIPTCYKFGTIQERFALMQGLMDTDGYIDNRGHCSYTTISKRLAEDVQFVLRSLGASAKITVDTNTGYKDESGEFIKCNDAYTVFIRMKDTKRLFRMARKKERCKEYNGGVSEVTRRIVGYRHIGVKDGRCITVDSPNSLYMTNDFIVTHNTFIGLFKFLPYIFNSDVNGYGFRKFEDDIARGIWKSSKQVYRGFGSSADTSFEWKFLGGKGATMKMEHLQDAKKVSDRFRGVEMAYILIEELAEHTRDSMNVLFDLLTSNRSTSGAKPQCVCTCNPVGKSNKLRYFLDYYIDPETDRIIPERSGHVRYFYRWGDDANQIVWGDSYEEVFDNAIARSKIERLMASTEQDYKNFITSLVFIDGDFKDNKILHVADSKYMSRISARGGESTVNDIEGVWRDIDSGSSLISAEEMDRFFNNNEQTDGVMRASADVALTGDFFVIFAFNGHHVCDMEAWRGVPTDEVIPFIDKFLKKNGVRRENFTYDSNGLGLWLKDTFTSSVGFNNKSAASDPRLWNNQKSECAEKFVKAIKDGKFSISEALLDRRFTDKKKNTFTLRDRLLEERLALKRKDSETARFEIISKPQMKLEIGHSPDFIEALFMIMPFFEVSKQCIRRGFSNWRH